VTKKANRWESFKGNDISKEGSQQKKQQNKNNAIDHSSEAVKFDAHKCGQKFGGRQAQL
jgi:hypothetical protein